MKNREDFTAINNCVFETPELIGGKWLSLYLVLSAMIGDGISPSQKELAKYTGHSETTIRKRIKTMEEIGLIETSKVGSKTLYTILPYKHKGELCFVDTRDLSDKEFEEFKTNNTVLW